MFGTTGLMFVKENLQLLKKDFRFTHIYGEKKFHDTEM